MRLTPRQAEIAAMVASGMRAKVIAAQTGLSRRTVEVHIRQAAERIPGDTDPRHKLTIWFLTAEREAA